MSCILKVSWGVVFAARCANSTYLRYVLAGFGVGEWVAVANSIAVFPKPDHVLTL